MNNEDSYIQPESYKVKYRPSSSTIITEFVPDSLLNGHSKKFIPDSLVRKVNDFIPDTSDRWIKLGDSWENRTPVIG